MRGIGGSVAARAAAGLAAVLAIGLMGAQAMRPGAAAVDSLRIINADKEPGSWLTTGRTYDEQRFSPLTQINDKNVGRLGLAWYKEFDTYRGNEATPLFADGVLYSTEPWNVVTAFDAKTGAVLWTYDPEVNRAKGREACCDIVTRGVALWKGKVIIATLDGRVIAVDSQTGKPVWSTQTFKGYEKWPYTITGAPRVYDGKVIIGNGGADPGWGVRGFVIALDAETGKEAWRFWTVPGDPTKKDNAASDSVQDMVRKTWNGTEYLKTGGGGTAWDSFAYDPKLGLVYIGVGNGSYWIREQRSPGGGDNLFLSSIVALDIKTGEYRWHYQQVPGDEWDYTATQQMTLADIKIDGKDRKVILQAPKNGFFYVLDRVTGKFISAKPMVRQNWNDGFDKDGRAIVREEARYAKPTLVFPAAIGAHNWNPQSYSPKTGLVYVPVNDQARVFFRAPPGPPGAPNPQAALVKELQEKASLDKKAWLSAWDPVAQKERWRVEHEIVGNGGVLSTAGNLVFQGTVDNHFQAYTADTGKKVWDFDAHNVAIGGAITYLLGGEQYIAVNVGWGGGIAHVDQVFAKGMNVSKGRLLVFKLGGKTQLPALAAATVVAKPPSMRISAEDYAMGEHLFEENCAGCHGTRAAGGVKDLRRMTAETRANFQKIVRGGILEAQGMASFADVIDEKQADLLLRYVTVRTSEDWGKF